MARTWTAFAVSCSFLLGLASAGGVLRLADREIEAPPAPVAAPAVDPAPDRLAERIDQLEAEVLDLRTRVQVAGTAPMAIPVQNGRDSIELQSQLIRAASEASRSVVCIQSGRQSGSGVIVTSQGHILTNHHVIGDATTVGVQLASGDRYVGKVLGHDSYSDVACVKIEGRRFPAIEFGDSDEVQVGQLVAALGDPFGISNDGTPAVSFGIVSALHRVVPMSGNREYRDAIQTDAAINPGNSGGALVDLDGRLVGINGAITTRTGSNSGVAFAIPVNFVSKILDRLKAGRDVEPGFLGIQVTDLSTQQIRTRGLRGALVSSVSPGSPAQSAGLRADDVILKLQARRIESSSRLLNYLSYHQPGEWIEIEVWRDGRLQTLSVQVGRRD